MCFPKIIVLQAAKVLLAIIILLHASTETAHSQDSGYDAALLENSFQDLTDIQTQIDPCFNKPCYKPVYAEHDFPKPDFHENGLLARSGVRTKYGFGLSSDEYSYVAPIGYLRVGFSCKYQTNDCVALLGAGYQFGSYVGLSVMERFGSGYDIDTRYSLTLKASENLTFSYSAKTQVKEVADHLYITEGRPISRVTNFERELERLIIIYLSTPGATF